MPHQYTPRRPLVERFWSKVDRSGTGCWLWLAGTFAGGYGSIKIDGRTHRAQRIAWELAYGPIAPGLEVCHNCPDGDNPRCVRPDHLFLGTHRENMRDSFAKGRSIRPDRAKLTPEHVREIRRRYELGGVTQKALAAEFGIDGRSVSLIVRHKTWKDVG